MNTSSGRLILLTGLSGSGKTTLGKLLADHLNDYGSRPAYLLDGDSIRAFFDDEIGYSPDARADITRRMSFGAYALVQTGVDVVMCNIAAEHSTRAFLRKRFDEFVVVFLNADVETLRRYDPKGLYSQAAELSTPLLVGIDLPYDIPTAPDIVVYPYSETPDESLQRILQHPTFSGVRFGTKAQTLGRLEPRTRFSTILPQVTTNWNEFRQNPSYLTRRIRDSFKSDLLAVRSSCSEEDTPDASSAGRFKSLLNVAAQTHCIFQALDIVRSDYAEKSVTDPNGTTILIQPMLTDVKLNGVLLTRHRHPDSCYLSIHFGKSAETDSVTKGRAGDTIYISRHIRINDAGCWSRLLEASFELERLLSSSRLDVEFALTQNDAVVILQCRPLLLNHSVGTMKDSVPICTDDLKRRFTQIVETSQEVVGRRTILSDMADWNPTEMIGERPSALAFSLYAMLITDSIWQEARSALGYHRIGVDTPLMVSLAGKPYIDTRASFNSLLPMDLPVSSRDALVNYALDLLSSAPELHDKIEFSVFPTCFTLSTTSQLSALPLPSGAITQVTESLRHLTFHLLRHAGAIDAQNTTLLNRLDTECEKILGAISEKATPGMLFRSAGQLLDRVRRFGTFPFAQQARLAFIAQSLARSLEEQQVVPPSFFTTIVAEAPTVASLMRKDLTRVYSGRLEESEFLMRYGHLRMGTYDITAPRYDQLPIEVLWKSPRSHPDSAEPIETHHDPHAPANQCFQYDGAVEKNLREVGLSVSFPSFRNFVRRSVQAREEGKFRFTRYLSAALEMLARGGATLGVSRDDLQHVPIYNILRSCSANKADLNDAKELLESLISEGRRAREAADGLPLPAVIRNPGDFDVIEHPHARPNFVTQRRIVAPVIGLTASTPCPESLDGKIVAIPQADPGFDWIFSRAVSGLVTKYGGAGSHMAIRCCEFGLPGAIGCGEAIFRRVLSAHMICLDCAERSIRYV